MRQEDAMNGSMAKSMSLIRNHASVYIHIYHIHISISISISQYIHQYHSSAILLVIVPHINGGGRSVGQEVPHDVLMTGGTGQMEGRLTHGTD